MVLQGKPSKQKKISNYFQPSSAIERLRKGGKVDSLLRKEVYFV